MNPPFIWRRKALKFAALALCAAPFAALAQTPTAPPAPIRLALIESMSGPFANTGEAVFRNLLWAVERVNARGGVKLPGVPGGSVDDAAQATAAAPTALPSSKP